MVATPIGNLRDITLRAVELLKSVDVIAAEDTRVTRKLLSHFGIGTRTIAVHQHNEREGAAALLRLLADGKSVALVTDAGTPGVSDPGATVVGAVRDAGYRVVPVPGASALTAALSASGLDSSRFLFCGFLPNRKGERDEILVKLARFRDLMIFYEAPHRVLATLSSMAAAFGGGRKVAIARELTKLFEELHITQLQDAEAWFGEKPERCRGEFVLLVEGFHGEEDNAPMEAHVLRVLLAELPLKQAVKMATEITGGRRNAIYQRALQLQDGSTRKRDDTE